MQLASASLERWAERAERAENEQETGRENHQRLSPARGRCQPQDIDVPLIAPALIRPCWLVPFRAKIIAFWSGSNTVAPTPLFIGSLSTDASDPKLTDVPLIVATFALMALLFA